MTIARTIWFALLATALLPGNLRAHAVGEEMADAANALLKSLSAEQRAQAVFTFKDDERLNWHFVPRARKGLAWGNMQPAQRQLARALLASGLSSHGLRKATNIMALETILHDLEGTARVFPRDPALYYVSIFGEPSDKTTWAWRVEGHHLAINVTIVAGRNISVSPTFMGTNPAEVKEGPHKGLRILAEEEDFAREFLASLDAAQRKSAIISERAPRDIITGNQRKVRALDPVGLAGEKMTAAQLEKLRKLVGEYAHRYRPELAAQDLAKIEKAGWAKVLFAWAGSDQRNAEHYYRVQGPTFLLEYDNTQNNANHIHSVWRDFENDFGADLLRQHYEAAPHPH